MPSVSIQITDADLIAKIQGSHLEDGQKKDLVELVADITQKERGDLIAMIDKASDEIAAANKRYDKKMGELNTEYAHKMNNMVREETASARKEFEAMDEAENEKEMGRLDEELLGNNDTEMDPRLREDDKRNQENPINQINPSSDKIKPKKHTLFKFIFVLLILGIIGIGAVWGINYLNGL